MHFVEAINLFWTTFRLVAWFLTINKNVEKAEIKHI